MLDIHYYLTGEMKAAGQSNLLGIPIKAGTLTMLDAFNHVCLYGLSDLLSATIVGIELPKIKQGVTCLANLDTAAIRD